MLLLHLKILFIFLNLYLQYLGKLKHVFNYKIVIEKITIFARVGMCINFKMHGVLRFKLFYYI